MSHRISAGIVLTVAVLGSLLLILSALANEEARIEYERGVRDGFADLCVQIDGFINQHGECEVEFPQGNPEGENHE